MKEYWTIVDDKHAGPYSAAELVEMGIGPTNMVWTQGLPDWVEAQQIEELKFLIDFRDRSGASAPESTEETVAVDEETVAVDEETAAPASEYDIASGQQTAPQPTPAPCRPQSCFQSAPPAHPGWQQATQAPVGAEPCPPAYLAWAIVVTILCCQILGVAAIVCSCLIKSNYNRGNLVKANKLSNATQWLIILSIVLGLLMLPLQIAFNGLLSESPF